MMVLAHEPFPNLITMILMMMTMIEPMMIPLLKPTVLRRAELKP